MLFCMLLITRIVNEFLLIRSYTTTNSPILQEPLQKFQYQQTYSCDT